MNEPKLKLVSFDDTFEENQADLADECGDAVAAISIDGYPSSEDCQGAVVCKLYVTRHGDMFTHWNLREYKDDEQVEALVEQAKARLRAAYLARPGAEKELPKVKIIVRDGVFSDVRVSVGTKLDIEVIQIDKDYPDHEKMCEYENAVYEDSRMYSADVTNVGFEEDDG